MSYCGCGMTLGMDAKCPACGGKGMGAQTPADMGRDYSARPAKEDRYQKHTRISDKIREGMQGIVPPELRKTLNK